MKHNPLLNPSFLKEVYNNRTRNLYVKIISHNLNGEPLECLEGMVTGGSVNLDGASPVRRSCTLTFSAKKNQIIHNYYWAMTTQFKMWIGVENLIDTDTYPEIIWFPFGWYLIASFSYSVNPTSYTINISGKDKMCMLNGELGGLFTSQTIDVSRIDEEQEDGSIITKDYTLQEIIYNLVHTYGREPRQNIIISDLDIGGSELLEYNGLTPLYLLINEETGVCEQYTTDMSLEIALVSTERVTTLSNPLIIHDSINQLDELKEQPTRFYLVRDVQILFDETYYSLQVQTGETIGYRPTDLTFAGKLIMNAGESVTAALDKIKNMLGYYEYFYNTDGQFVFQKKRTSLATRLSNLREDSEGVAFVQPAALHEQYTYNFDNNELLTQLSNTMQIVNLKNDFTVWGTNGTGNPIHMRYAIDEKPLFYKAYDGTEYATDVELYSPTWSEASPDEERTVSLYNWREILYQMAKDDVYRTKKKDGVLVAPDFREKLIQNNPKYSSGYTNYEQYYTDLDGFWRTLYHPNPPKEYFERAYSDTTPNKHVYEYKECVLAEKWQKDISWSNIYCFDQNDELQKYIDLLNIIDANPFDKTNFHKSMFTISDELLLSNLTHFSIPKKCLTVEHRQNDDTDNKLDLFLNCLHYPKGIGYIKLIDTISYEKEQLYVQIHNPDYVAGENDEPEMIYVPIFDALSSETKDKVYVSQENIGSTAKKYEDYFSVETYQGEQIKFVDDGVYYLDSTTGDYIKIRELLLQVPKDEVLFWSSSSHQIITDDVAQLFLAAQKDHYENVIVITESGERKWLSAVGGLFVKGRRKIERPFWWYKNTKDSEPVYLTQKILVDYKTDPDNCVDVFCKYSDIYVERLETDSETNIYYLPPLDLIDINKDELHIRLDRYNEKNELVYSDFQLLTNYLKFDQIQRLENIVFFEKLETKIDIVKKAQEEYVINGILKKPFEPIYFDYLLAENELNHDCNKGVQKHMKKTKKNLYGSDHVLTKNKKIETLLLYWELYYNYQLPKEKQQYLDTDTYVIDRSGCWQSEVYKDFNKALFWIDFFDTQGTLSQNSVKNIGLRSKVENNQTATALSFGDVPNLQWVEQIPPQEQRSSAYKYILITDGVRNLIQQSAQGRACKDVIDEWLNKYATISNTLSFSCIPIYHLEPNTEVFLNNQDLNVYGSYEINRITLPLTYNGMMQLSVTKIIDEMI